jgi:hypothetical protein
VIVKMDLEYECGASEGGLHACAFVISDIQWASAADLQRPIHELTAPRANNP